MSYKELLDEIQSRGYWLGDVCRLLNVHINTVRRWNNRGLLKANRIGPRGDRRFRQEDIITFLIEQSQNAGME